MLCHCLPAIPRQVEVIHLAPGLEVLVPSSQESTFVSPTFAFFFILPVALPQHESLSWLSIGNTTASLVLLTQVAGGQSFIMELFPEIHSTSVPSKLL